VGREADHSPPSSDEVKECVELYLHFPNTLSWRGAQLKHGDNFTFVLKKHGVKVRIGLKWRIQWKDPVAGFCEQDDGIYLPDK
jgi:hypothetical protein